MKILFLLTYFHPHLSGLTIAARNRAEGLAARHHQVSVIASQHRTELPLEETRHGVRILRVPVRFRASKGVVMKGHASRVHEEFRSHDVAVQYLPASPFEAWHAARAACRYGKPMLIDYACDIQLPGGLASRLVERATLAGNRVAAKAAKAIVFSTAEYASASPFGQEFRDKIRVAPLTIVAPLPDAAGVQALRQRHAPNGEKLIGFAGRMAAEKGVEFLLGAVRILLAQGRNVRLLLAGDVANVIGEEAYRKRILKALDELGDRFSLLGPIQPDLSAFYAACDVLVLPSLNRTESFGMVQAEAMRCGTPVVASDLPGVRQSVLRTGMGRIAPPGNAEALAVSIADVLQDPGRYCAVPETIDAAFSVDQSLDEFERILREFVP